MKIRIYSDLHLEFDRDTSIFREGGDEDLVVLAGDIDVGTAGVKWAKETFPHVPVVYVLGNHEYYGYTFETLVDECKAAARGSNVHVLECDALDVLGIRVLGCTLWTDFNLYGAEKAAEAKVWARQNLADFWHIRFADRRAMTTQQSVALFEKSSLWIDRQIAAADRPVLVVTHYAPTDATASPIYCGSISNASFHSAADYLIRSPVRMWIHGHTHCNADAPVNGIRVTSNQWGYPSEDSLGFRKNGIFLFGDVNG